MQNSSGLNTMSSAIKKADNYNQWILQYFRPYLGNSLLEIGTGFGNFRRHLYDIKKYVSVDIDTEVVERAKKADMSGDYLVADVADKNIIDKLKGFTFDSVLCVNVLEHVKNDRDAVMNMMQLIDNDGHLLLFVPALPGLYSDMDKLAGHVRRYRKRDITKIFEGTDYQIKKLEYFNPLGGMGWWFNKFFAHTDLDSNAINKQIEFFNRYIVPLSKKINILTRYFFGQSLICVVQKR